MKSKRPLSFADQSLVLLGLVNLSSFSLFISQGRYNLAALIAYVLSAAVLAAMLIRGRFEQRNFQSRRWSIRALYFSLLLATLFQLLNPQLRFVANLDLYLITRLIGLLAFFVVIIQYLRIRSANTTKRVILPLLFVSALILVMFSLVPFVSPNPFIDVVVFYEESAQALLQGLNPYEVTYTNIYYPSTFYYPGGAAKYYPYPPLTLIVGLSGLVTGDPRWLLIVAHLLVGFFLFRTAHCRGISTEESLLLALLFLYVPVSLSVAESGWTDPLTALAVAAFSYFLALGKLRPALLAAGCALALKQTMIVFLPLLALFWQRDRGKRLLMVLLVPAATYLGFAVWSWGGLLEDLIQFHLLSPFRPGGLTLSALMYRLRGQPLPFTASLPPLLLGLSLAVLRLYRVNGVDGSGDPPGPDRATLLWTIYAMLFLFALIFSKHAFVNYYYYFHFLLVLSLLWSRISDQESPGSSA